MADAVSVRTLIDDGYQVGVLLNSVSDGTGEAAVSKIAIASVAKAYAGDAAAARTVTPVALDLMSIQWSVTGFTKVQLLFKATTNDLFWGTAAGGIGHLDLTGRGILVGDSCRTSYGLANKALTGFVGDILLTSAGATGSTYTIVAFFKKRPA